MRLKWFLLFILVFVMVPNICFAENSKTYYLYNKKGDEELFSNAIYAMCGSDSVNCKFECYYGNKLYNTYSEDLTLGNTIYTVTNSGFDVVKVTAKGLIRINDLDFGGIPVAEWLKENYCPSAKTNNDDDLCNLLSSSDGRVPYDESDVRYCNAKLFYLKHINGEIDSSMNVDVRILPNLENDGYPDFEFAHLRSDDYSDIGQFQIYPEEKYVKFYTNRYNFYSKFDPNKKAFAEEFKRRYSHENKCPTFTFCLANVSGKGNDYDFEWFAEFDNSCKDYDVKTYQTVDTHLKMNDGIVFVDSLDKIPDDKVGDRINILDCAEFLGADTPEGKELIGLIKWIVRIIFILVPIILLVVTIVDFSKAVFSGEDGMKKAQGNFFKRILIAVLIFLIPTLIKLILTIGNLVWPDIISPDLCGIL